MILVQAFVTNGNDRLSAQLCRRVQELIDHNSEPQLSIELASECLSLAPWDCTPAATLLDRLKRSREAWQTLRPTRKETILLQGDIYLTYEMCGYMFAQGKPSQTGTRPVDDDPFGTRMLEFWEMPVGGMPVDGENSRNWYRKYEDMGMDVVDFTFDPSQDALFLVEKQGFVDLSSLFLVIYSITHSRRSRYVFHLRTLSGNLHHPDAKMIEMATEGPPELARCDLQIRCRYVAALIISPLIDDDDVFVMWDWKSGECVLVSSLYRGSLSLSLTRPLLARNSRLVLHISRLVHAAIGRTNGRSSSVHNTFPGETRGKIKIPTVPRRLPKRGIQPFNGVSR